MYYDIVRDFQYTCPKIDICIPKWFKLNECDNFIFFKCQLDENMVSEVCKDSTISLGKLPNFHIAMLSRP